LVEFCSVLTCYHWKGKRKPYSQPNVMTAGFGLQYGWGVGLGLDQRCYSTPGPLYLCGWRSANK